MALGSFTRRRMLAVLALTSLFAGCDAGSDERVQLLNVSYDPTRELWRELNGAFAAEYKESTGREVTIDQSHGGSGSQARAVIDGLEADVVTLAMWGDTNAIAKAGLINAGWNERFPNSSLPYYSTIVFVVRKGNPKNIKDWPDLVQEGVEIVTPSPKTSGNGKLTFLAAWGSVVKQAGGSEEDAKAFVEKLYKRVPVLDAGARAATVTFAQKQIGDVHVTWENEAHLEVKESKGELEIVYPVSSIQAEPRVAVVDKNVDRKGTRDAAEAYLNFLYTVPAQEILAKNYFRPIKPEVLHQYKDFFSPLELFSIKDISGGWDDADQKFFAEGAIFDQIYQPQAK